MTFQQKRALELFEAPDVSLLLKHFCGRQQLTHGRKLHIILGETEKEFYLEIIRDL